ncbi:MAG: TVP38/TMEM64 family protein [Anaerolineae bacterium]
MSRRTLIAGGITALVGLAAAIYAIWRVGLVDILQTRAALERLVAGLGPWGPVAIIVAEVLQVLLAPVPGQIVGVVAGYFYGPVWGTLLSLAGLVLGSLLAIGLARRLGRPLVERLTGPDTLQRIDAHVDRHGPWALFLIFLLPFLPDDAACFVAGLTRLRVVDLVVLATLGRAPGVIVSTLIGSQARTLSVVQLVAIAIASAVLALLLTYYRAPIERRMFHLLERCLGRRHVSNR